MDQLIKNNIVKKNKIIVDVGRQAVKVMEVHYESRQAEIIKATTIDGMGMYSAGGLDIAELARRVDRETQGRGRRDISVSLSSEFCDNKIINIKNKKDSEIPKIIAKEYSSFGRVNPVTHVIDYAFLGRREEQGDTVGYYLISAIPKSVANELVEEFENRDMKIKTMVSSIYNQVCLSELWYNEYEHLNRLFVDIDANSTCVTAFAEGVAVYTRVVDIGFENYVDRLFSTKTDLGKSEIKEILLKAGDSVEGVDKLSGKIEKDVYREAVAELDSMLINELERIVDLCSNNDISITKIYITGQSLNGFCNTIKEDMDIECEEISFSSYTEKEGKGYLFWTGDVSLDKSYSNVVGMAVYPLI